MHKIYSIKAHFLFLSCKDAKFRATVQPGDRLKLCCDLVKQKGPMGVGKAVAYVGDKKVCECELIFAIGK